MVIRVNHFMLFLSFAERGTTKLFRIGFLPFNFVDEKEDPLHHTMRSDQKPDCSSKTSCECGYAPTVIFDLGKRMREVWEPRRVLEWRFGIALVVNLKRARIAVKALHNRSG